MKRFFPFFVWFGAMNRQSLIADMWAALTASVLVLPQAIAFAAIAGMPIEYGFYTALVTPIIAAFFGCSKQMVSGPTTAISVLLFAGLSQQYDPFSVEYIQAAIAVTLLAGIFQIVLGSIRLGSLSSFVSPSVMVGFTASAGVIIAYSQFSGVVGLSWQQIMDAFNHNQLLATLQQDQVSYSLVIALSSLITALLVNRYFPKLPNYLCALLVGGLIAYFIDANDAGAAFVEFKQASGEAISVMPSFALPAIDLSSIESLAKIALAVALVGLLEATAITRSLAAKTGQDININQEFIGQGLSNMVGSCFSAYMGSGSFTRSAANLDAGAVTPLSAVLSSVFLFIILLFVKPWISYIPLSAIAGIIVLVAFRLIEYQHIKNIIKTSPTSTTVMSVTFGAALLFGLDFGIYVGVLVSLSFFLGRSLSPQLTMTAPDPETEERSFRNAQSFDLDECPQLGVGRLDGQLYFGSIDELRRQFRHQEKHRSEQKSLLILLKSIDSIDMPGAELIIEEARRRRQRGGNLYITSKRRQDKRFKQFNIIKNVGAENTYFSKNEALVSIIPQLDQSICDGCTKRIFRECPVQTNE